MGCFGCFRGCKESKRRNKRIKQIHKNHRYGMHNAAERTTLFEHGSPSRETAMEPVNFVPEQPVPEEQSSTSPSKKRVTFNSNVKTYEPVLVSTDSLLAEDRKEFKVIVDKLRDDDLVSENGSITSSGGSYPPNHRYQNCRESDDETEEFGDSDSDDNDDDGDDIGENDDDGTISESREKEVYPESVVTELTGLRTKNPLVRMNSEEVNSPFKEPGLADEGYGMKDGYYARVNSPFKEPGLADEGYGMKDGYYARDRSTHAHPVLNPVENLTQWKAVKSKGSPRLPLKPQKENSSADIEAPRVSVSSEPMFKHLSSLPKPKPNQRKTTDQDVAVDASLSNWLVSPETTPAKKTNNSSGLETITSGWSGSPCSNSAVSFEDRPILGALTVEELRHMSATNSPRKSPTHSPDDMPIIGTVGTYWNDTSSKKDSTGPASSFKGIPNTSSKYREDKTVKWNSTPFETRLERALNRGAAE